MSEKIIQPNGKIIKGELKKSIRSSVKERLSRRWKEEIRQLTYVANMSMHRTARPPKWKCMDFLSVMLLW